MIKYFYKKKQKKYTLLYNKQQRGFSLIELMVVVVILGIIVLGLVTFFTGGVKSWVAGQSQLEAQRNARWVMDRMVREIREADYIENSSTSSYIDFHTPFSGTISYSLLGGSDLKRGSNTMISNVQSLTFSYFDNSSNPVDSSEPDKKSKVSKVHIDLQVNVDKDSNPDITLNSDIDLRNYDL
jgi:prepilin-type N-terminal cleavage/methylation domain-containing protein